MQTVDGNSGHVSAWLNNIGLWRGFSFLMLLLAGFPALAASNKVTDHFGCSAEIRVAVFEFGPWYENGKGITVDLMEAIRQRTGCRIKLVETSRAEAWAAIARNEIDLIPTSIQTRERLKVARFVTFLRIRNLMIVRTDLDASAATMDHFVVSRNRRIGLIRGFLYGSHFDLRLRSLLGDDRTLSADNPRQLVDMLRQGKVDAILMPSAHYFSYVPELERQTSFRVLDTSVSVPQTSGFALSRGTFSSLQTDNWLRLIESMFLDGSLESILARHLPPRIAATITIR